MQIGVDMTKCQSYAQCCFLAPDVFTFDGELALVHDPRPGDAQRLRAAQEVVLADGDRVGFDRLVIATGSRARPWPHPSEAALAGVHTLRTADDAAGLRRDLQDDPGRVLVIDGGFTGSEVASACRGLGLPVTLVDRGPAPLTGGLGQIVGSVAADVQREHGVDLRSRTSVTELEGDGSGRLRRAHLSDGSTLEVDVAVVALGAVRDVGWLQDTGLDADERGVTVDTRCRVLDREGRVVPDVFAAGDVARFPQQILDGDLSSVEHWGNAVSQAEVAAHNLVTGGAREHDEVPVFWSIRFGHVLKAVGVPAATEESVLVQGSLESRSFVVAHGARGRIVGAVTVNQSKWLDHYARLITAGAPFPPQARTVDRPAG